jgi:hygromycin-B 7''-O-kinase
LSEASDAPPLGVKGAPPPVGYSAEAVRAIARKHGVEGEVRRLPNSGMVNEAWLLGERHVLRIIREAEAEDEAEREALVVPLVRAAGVRTPELLAVDYSREIVPRPYTLYERAPGTLLGDLDRTPEEFEGLSRELGRQIARIVRVQPDETVRSHLRTDGLDSPRPTLRRAVDEGVVSLDEAAETEALLDRLDELGGEEGPPVFIHKDLHPWNITVDEATGELASILDWGDASLGDASTEFASMPLASLPAMFEGYREEGGAADPPFVARTLRAGLGLALWEIRKLDPAVFKRQWWRLSEAGLGETLRLVRVLSVEC